MTSTPDKAGKKSYATKGPSFPGKELFKKLKIQKMTTELRKSKFV